MRPEAASACGRKLTRLTYRQEEIKHIKEFIASCGTFANLVRQALLPLLVLLVQNFKYNLVRQALLTLLALLVQHFKYNLVR
jgi:hypothetical protein